MSFNPHFLHFLNGVGEFDYLNRQEEIVDSIQRNVLLKPLIFICRLLKNGTRLYWVASVCTEID